MVVVDEGTLLRCRFPLLSKRGSVVLIIFKNFETLEVACG